MGAQRVGSLHAPGPRTDADGYNVPHTQTQRKINEIRRLLITTPRHGPVILTMQKELSRLLEVHSSHGATPASGPTTKLSSMDPLEQRLLRMTFCLSTITNDKKMGLYDGCYTIPVDIEDKFIAVETR
jgi:hypothetical protein